MYIERFNFAMTQYLQALAGIVPIFNYMVSIIVLSYSYVGYLCNIAI